jgi:hypothetical protein
MTTVTLAPGCGFGFWHIWGVLRARKPTGSVWCISGSAMAMVVYLCDLDVETELQRCSSIRSSVTFCNVVRVVRTWLECALPDDCHARCNGRMVMLLRNIYRAYAVEHISHWSDKTDLIDCLVAACTPLLPTRFRNRWYTDCLVHTHDQADVLPSRLVFGLPDKEGARNLYIAGLRDGRESAPLTECAPESTRDTPPSRAPFRPTNP